MRSSGTTITVHKFGGAALIDAGAIRRAVALLSGASSGRRVVVTSALGGVTSALHSVAQRAALGDLHGAHGEARSLRFRHLQVARELLEGERVVEACDHITESFNELDCRLEIISRERCLTPAAADIVLARGERAAACLMTHALASADIPARTIDAAELLHTDGRFGDAAPDLRRTAAAARTLILPALEAGDVVVVPGFFGAASNGAVATLGRGGSDLTATLVARVLGAAEVTLWKDVPGFLTADPRLVPDARVVAQLDPREAAELANHGASVLHPRALTPLDGGTTLRIRPFADPNAPGTTILRGRTIPGKPVRAISATTRQALVTLEGNGMIDVAGFAVRALGVLAGTRISPSFISHSWSEQAICFTVPEPDAEHVRERLQREFANEIARGDVEQVEVVPGLATVVVVGTGMSRAPGVAARVFGAVADAHVSAVAIVQGSSARCISLVIHAEHVPEVVRAIHAAFRLDKVGGGRMDTRRGADVILLGCGRIGRELLEQINAPSAPGQPALRVIAVLDRDGFVFDHRGLHSRRLATIAMCKRRGGSLNALPVGRSGTPLEAIELIASHALRRPVIVDVAAGDTGPMLLAAVRHGMQVVLANKVPLSSGRDAARVLLAEARSRGCQVRYEATVGAGLPVIDTIEKLFASGDQVLKVAGCPSGTMGYLMTELGRGRRFSEALRQAMRCGYTEPDPREDLSGCDVARKALILGRLLGYDGEIDDVKVESLVPDDQRDVPLADFLEQLETLDQIWLDRIEAARVRGEVLRYRAHASRASVRVGLVGVPVGSSLAALDGTDNQFVFTTARYRENPLVISGPGAGPAVTAAGVFNDILRIAGNLDIPPPRPWIGDRKDDPAPAGTHARTGGGPVRSTSSARA